MKTNMQNRNALSEIDWDDECLTKLKNTVMDSLRSPVACNVHATQWIHIRKSLLSNIQRDNLFFLKGRLVEIKYPRDEDWQ
jgi:hypothetical protein